MWLGGHVQNVHTSRRRATARSFVLRSGMLALLGIVAIPRVSRLLAV